MGRVIKPLATVEVLLLLAVVGVGLAVLITTLKATEEIPNVTCLLYTEVDFVPDPPLGWDNVTFTQPSDDAKCNFGLASQIITLCFAFICALYRAATICVEELDSSFVRMLTIPVYLMATTFALIKSMVLQLGFNRFCRQLSAYSGSSEKYGCETAENFIAGLAGAPKSEFDFVNELSIATRASWISLGLWLLLTFLTVISFVAARNRRSERSIKT